MGVNVNRRPLLWVAPCAQASLQAGGGTDCSLYSARRWACACPCANAPVRPPCLNLGPVSPGELSGRSRHDLLKAAIMPGGLEQTGASKCRVRALVYRAGERDAAVVPVRVWPHRFHVAQDRGRRQPLFGHPPRFIAMQAGNTSIRRGARMGAHAMRQMAPSSIIASDVTMNSVLAAQ